MEKTMNRNMHKDGYDWAWQRMTLSVYKPAEIRKVVLGGREPNEFTEGVLEAVEKWEAEHAVP